MTVIAGSRLLTIKSSASELFSKCATGSEISYEMSPPGGHIEKLHPHRTRLHNGGLVKMEQSNAVCSVFEVKIEIMCQKFNSL